MYTYIRTFMNIRIYLCIYKCVAVCCRVLQCVAERCSVLQCVAVCCSRAWRPRILHCSRVCGSWHEFICVTQWIHMCMTKKKRVDMCVTQENEFIHVWHQKIRKKKRNSYVCDTKKRRIHVCLTSRYVRDTKKNEFICVWHKKKEEFMCVWQNECKMCVTSLCFRRL